MTQKITRILLVEDSPTDTAIIRKLLSEAPGLQTEVTHAPSLQGAYQTIKVNPFDVIFLDLTLPDATGFEAFVWLYAQAPEIPIIILTGRDDLQLAVKAIRKGAEDYLIKGMVDSTRLAHAVTYAIERHQLKLALKESEQKCRNIFETANDAILAIDAETGTVLDANKKAEELIGLPVEKIVGLDQAELHPEDQRDRHHKIFLERVGQGHSVFTNLYVRHRDGRLIPVEISSSVTEVEGKMIVQSIYRDITERKKVEKLKDEFVSAVSHELRTPLTSIREGVSQFLDGLLGPTTDEQKQFLNIILEDIDRLQQIIDELLDISKIESGKIELRRVTADLCETARKVLPRFHGFLKKSIELKSSLPEGPVRIFFDTAKVTQVITNLISNAYKFTPDNGTVTLSVEDRGKDALVCVADTGVGISRENIPKIFEKFTQVNRTDGPGIKGTGLGLPISKSFVEMHGGEMWAESEVGNGTRMFFTIPRIPREIMFREYLRGRIEDATAREVRLVLLMADAAGIEEARRTIGPERLDEIFGAMKALAEKCVFRSDDAVLEHDSGFAVILFDTDRKGGLTVGKRIRETVSSVIAEKKMSGSLDVNIGMAIYPDQEKYIDNLITTARQNLLRIDLKKVCVLLVDDETAFTEIMKIKMTRSGFGSVLTAPDGQQALEVLKNKKPDILILDMNMPVMNGYEVIGRLKTDPQTAGIPVIILSGYPVDNRKLGETGARSIPVLSKPLDDKDLFENIEKALFDNL